MNESSREVPTESEKLCRQWYDG